tara:strand:+ start:2441 stop:2698 length:258 start_codon:yes stop_codon:yes gene_type:complete
MTLNTHFQKNGDISNPKFANTLLKNDFFGFSPLKYISYLSIAHPPHQKNMMGAKNRIVAKTTHQTGLLGMTKPATRTTKKRPWRK